MERLPEMIKALLEPGVYPEPTGTVELVQTQMSFVLLGDNYVYKIKKPVNLGYLDYSTLENRRFYCRKEIELNRRLCPDTYLGVVTINNREGIYSINGKGRAVEYAVKMRRLPGEYMMDNLLSENRVSVEMVTRLAEKLANFHRHAAGGVEISGFGSLETVTQNTEENFIQTEKYIGRAITRPRHEQIRDYTRGFIKENSTLFQKRMAEGRIRDCHGDLHATHICFVNGICIYDCIEFNDRFRYGDVASEVAFLAMDIDRYAKADLSRAFVESYIEFNQDMELNKLLNFYKCYRAYVRGKVACFKLDDPYIGNGERDKALKDAASYFDLAYSYTRPKPALLITAGLMGCGKSTMAQSLAGRLGLVVISSDVTRKRLASVRETEHRFEAFDTGIYSPGFSRKTYDAMYDQARSILSEGGSVIIDASFIKSGERLRAKSLAEESGACFFILECTLNEELTRKRLAERLEHGTVSDGRWEIYQAQRDRFEPVVEIPPENRVIIDSSLPLDKVIGQVLDRIG
jgi:hypothetical protein